MQHVSVHYNTMTPWLSTRPVINNKFWFAYVLLFLVVISLMKWLHSFANRKATNWYHSKNTNTPTKQLEEKKCVARVSVTHFNDFQRLQFTSFFLYFYFCSADRDNIIFAHPKNVKLFFYLYLVPHTQLTHLHRQEKTFPIQLALFKKKWVCTYCTCRTFNYAYDDKNRLERSPFN